VTDPLKAFLQAASLEISPFAPTSRYHGLASASWTRPDGLEVRYVTRRFVPPPEELASVGEHVISEGDRLDNLAAHYLGDPDLFWRLCDANRGLGPGSLTEVVGARLKIALPQGIPGGPNA